jgi:hypothetical protein
MVKKELHAAIYSGCVGEKLYPMQYREENLLTRYKK